MGLRRRFFCTDWRSRARAAKSRDNSSASGTFKAMGLEEEEEGEDSWSRSSSDSSGDSVVRSELESDSNEYGSGCMRSRIGFPEVIGKKEPSQTKSRSTVSLETSARSTPRFT